VKRTFISAVAVLAFAATAHADELTDIQAQAKQLREQNQAMTKRLADLEKRQKALETKPVAVSAVNPVDSMAADLPYKAAVKARPPENDDLCWHGVCLYGNFDMGLTYNQHGNPISAYESPNYLPEKNSNGSYFGAASMAMSASFIGLRGKQEIADNLYAVFNLQTIFEPNSGMNMNGLGAIAQSNGMGAAPFLQNVPTYGDTSKAGQMFNNAAYFGISSPTYGTFTMGRQSALSSDNVVNYDPISGAGAFSAIAFEGAAGGGGNTENRIWDNSYEYRLNVGPVRLAAEAQLRSGWNSATGNAFQGDIGFDYMGFSMDFLGGKTFDSLSLAGGTMSAFQTGLVSALPGGALECGVGCLAGTISDNTVFQVAAKYVIGPWKLFGGYEHIQYANPDSPLNSGANVMGGYNLVGINNGLYQTDRIMHIFWVGAKYAVTPTLDIMAAYYGYRQENYVAGFNPGGLVNNPVTTKIFNGGAPCDTAVSPGCSATMDMVSFVADWRFARHMDLYAGVAYSQKTGGFLNGYTLATTGSLNAAYNNLGNKASTYDPTIGLRYQF
jgi:predicted porin